MVDVQEFTYEINQYGGTYIRVVTLRFKFESWREKWRFILKIIFLREITHDGIFVTTGRLKGLRDEKKEK